MKSVNWLDVAVRALKTFVQAALAVLAVTNEPFSKAALTAAFAAGVSAVWNFVREYVNKTA